MEARICEHPVLIFPLVMLSLGTSKVRKSGIPFQGKWLHFKKLREKYFFFPSKQLQIFCLAEFKEINLRDIYWQNTGMGLSDTNYCI